MDLFLNPEKCTGCCSCVLACSWHHARRFDRAISSIRVSQSGKERKAVLLLNQGKEGEGYPCDGCPGEKEPLCVRYCATQAILESRQG